MGAYFKTSLDNKEYPSSSKIRRIRRRKGSAGLREEFYTFQENPRGRVQVLLRLDPTSVGSAGDYPLAWVQSVGAGRAYYNALGHFSGTWTDQRFQRQLIGAIRWTASRV